MDKKFVSKENAQVLYNSLKSYVDTEVSDASTQYEVMPAASAENEGQIIQYTGQTDQNYTNGYFYQVISDGQEPATYSWENMEVQDTGVKVYHLTGIYESYSLLNSADTATVQAFVKDYVAGKKVEIVFDELRGLSIQPGIGYTGKGVRGIVGKLNKSISITFPASRSNMASNASTYIAYPASWRSISINDYTNPTYMNYIYISYSQTSASTTGFIVTSKNTFNYTPENDYNPATKKYVDDKATSYTTVPTASASNEGKIIQYTGATDSTYTNGYFYKCVSDGQDPATYSWVAVPTQNITHPEYTIAVATTTSGYAKSYELTKDSVATGVKIDIPKDLVISNGEVKTVTTADVPYAGAQVGDKYIDITLNDASANHIYIPVNDLVDAYTAGNGINIDNNNQVSIKLDSSNANGITVGANGISLAEATTNTPGAMSAADKTKLATVSSNADENVIEIVKVNGSALTPDQDKAVNVTVPTSLSDLDADAANLVHDANYVHTDNNYTTAEKTKMAAVPNFSFGTADPTGGNDGDIYFQYSA